MSLVEHAKRELELAGLLDEDSDYAGLVGKAALELIEVFAKQGHSGFSAGLTVAFFTKLASYKPLTPLTNNPDEWLDRSEESGYPIWQNKRSPNVFSKDGGKTTYTV